MDIPSYLLGKQAGGGGGDVSLQTNKSVTITSNGETVINPDEGYEAMEKVTVTTNIPSGGESQDWAKIGYDAEPAFIGEAYEYALEILNNWESSITSTHMKFFNDKQLVIMPFVDTSNVTNMAQTFMTCNNLSCIPKLNTSKNERMYRMFLGCTNLKILPVLDTTNVTNFQDAFKNCEFLSNDSLNNILKMCINAQKYNSTKTLAYIGLTSSQATTCTTLSNYQDFVDAGWTTGY